MLVGDKVCDLTEDLLWFVCGNFDVFPYSSEVGFVFNIPCC